MKLDSRVVVAAGLSFTLGLVGGCSVESTHYENQQYACRNDQDCAPGNTCVSGLCQGDGAGGGTAGGGATGGGSATGGGGATGGGSATGGGGAEVFDAGCAGSPEVCGDQVDDNCNGLLDDGCPCTGVGVRCYPMGLDSPTLRYPYDGGAGCSAGLQACINGLLAAGCDDVHVPQLEFCDGKDTDCDGLPDLPNCPCTTGYGCYQGIPFTPSTGACQAGTWNCALPAGTQCVGQVLPAVRESCNGVDDDCNGEVDENVQTAPCGVGVCASANKVCSGGAELACDFVTNPPPGYAATELCGDGLDNNCDGFAENGCTCVLSATVTCWSGSSSACPNDGGACLGVCARGTQTCAAPGDGGLAYGSCAGQTGASNESCSDSLDNDCDGQRDCLDTDCTGRSCGLNGRACKSGSCQCLMPDGGAGQAFETTCTDALDNDCDGLRDCAESVCNGQACGSFGRTCVGTSCSCLVDGGTVQAAETLCNDTRDNDCDGLIDCQESACSGQACGLNGRKCAAGACACLMADGGVQATETSCSDALDNDCDGLVDCADSNCAAAANCASADAGVLTETLCDDLLDNDGDALVDCLDPDCLHKRCGLAGTACCSTAPSATACKNLTNDPLNCGVCGVSCASGSCTGVSGGAYVSGSCTCPGGFSSQCPTPVSGVRQNCSANRCSCSADSDACGRTSTGASCYSGSTPDLCHY